VKLIAKPYYKFVYSGSDGYVLTDNYSVSLSCQANRLWNISLDDLTTTCKMIYAMFHLMIALEPVSSNLLRKTEQFLFTLCRVCYGYATI
jgi:hypothetical protein